MREKLSASEFDSRAVDIIKSLHDAGHQAYIVGGAIRDLLLGIKPKDFDISTSATPEQVRKVFGRRRAYIIGKRFQIVHLYVGRHLYEISTFRRMPNEQERKGRAADDGEMVWSDNYWGSPEEDAFRRDFTMNALFFDPFTDGGKILDYTGGVEDMKKRVVRSIGDPNDRFIEDPVRMLRALKLTAQFDFRLCSQVRDAIHTHAEKISLASQRRLWEEILKLTYKPFLALYMRECHRHGLLQHLFPGAEVMMRGDDAQQWIEILEERDSRVARGQSMSRAYTLPLLCYRFIELKINPGCEFGDSWEGGEGIDRKIRRALFEFMEPHNITKVVSARVRDVVMMLARLRKRKYLNRLARHPDFRYALLVYETLAPTCNWPEITKEELEAAATNSKDDDAPSESRPRRRPRKRRPRPKK